MSLKEILEKFVREEAACQLWDGSRNWNADELLGALPHTRLMIRAYLQPGLYIAEISEAGYLGRVLYTLKAGGISGN